MSVKSRAETVKRLAFELGFDLCGIAPAEPWPRAAYVRQWMASGRVGSMDYLPRYTEQRLDPRQLLDGTQSVIVVGMLYHQSAPPNHPVDEPNDAADAEGEPAPEEPRGRVAMYAWGDDYHKVVKKRLFALADRLREVIEEPFEARACVDTAPVLEREAAARAGLGWIGKNTLVLHPQMGSYFFVGEIVTTLALAADEPIDDHCGQCTACLDACPTDAFPVAYEMDASRCISYLTIERRADIPSEFHQDMGNWVFGCDVCQEVCPFNRTAPPSSEPRFEPRDPGPAPRLVDLLNWSDEQYADKLRGSAIKRARPEMLRRNARIAQRNAQTGRNGS